MAAGLGMPRQFLLFAGAGAIGFVVEAVVITALVTLWDVDIYVARLCSFSLAVLITWWLNREFAFSGMTSRVRLESMGSISWCR